jgi:hypothetical protein
MSLFNFTFSEGDTFKHTLKYIEKYVAKNIKPKEKLAWKPRLGIKVFGQNTTIELKQGLDVLNRVYPQSLYIQVINGTSLEDHITFDIEFDRDEKVWVVKAIQYPAALW